MFSARHGACIITVPTGYPISQGSSVDHRSNRDLEAMRSSGLLFPCLWSLYCRHVWFPSDVSIFSRTSPHPWFIHYSRSSLRSLRTSYSVSYPILNYAQPPLVPDCSDALRKDLGTTLEISRTEPTVDRRESRQCLTTARDRQAIILLWVWGTSNNLSTG